MLSFFIVAAIVIAVVIGYKTGFNTGFFAIIFAYLIGGFALEMSPGEIIGGWPVNTMFVIFSVSLFYNFALVNGTLEKTARYLLYAFRKFPALLPFALYFASAGISALGGRLLHRHGIYGAYHAADLRRGKAGQIDRRRSNQLRRPLRC